MFVARREQSSSNAMVDGIEINELILRTADGRGEFQSTTYDYIHIQKNDSLGFHYEFQFLSPLWIATECRSVFNYHIIHCYSLFNFIFYFQNITILSALS